MSINHAPSDVAAVDSFLQSVSWGEECTIYQEQTKPWVKVSNLYVLVPTDCEGYPDNLEEVFLAARTLELPPGVIFYGEPTDYLRDEMNYTAHRKGLVVYWVGAENRLAYSSWLLNLSEGFDLTQAYSKKVK